MPSFCALTFCASTQWPISRVWSRLRYSLLFLFTLVIVAASASPVTAMPVLGQFSSSTGSNNDSYTLGWVKMDGYDTFQISAPNLALSQRKQQIQQNLLDIRDRYLQLETPAAQVSTQRSEGQQPKIYVNGQYLMTVTQKDANLQGTTEEGIIRRLENSIPTLLEKTYRQRQPDYRQRQYRLIGIAFAGAIAIIIALSYFSKQLTRWGIRALGTPLDQSEMTEDQRHQLQDIRERVLPVLQIAVLIATGLWALGLFPETRVWQQDFLSSLKFPITLGIAIVIAYTGIRLTYAVINKIIVGLTDQGSLSSYYSRRTELRISTLTSVIKNITNFVWLAIGFIVALSVTSIDLGLLLASVGIIGLAISLAAQNLVRGAVNGFFIVLEDQFAIGDVVKIGDDAGVVEKLNLRITQLRDTAGRLITIPTSDITRVANYSLHWSRSDLKIPVHYNADINHMLDVTRQVGDEMIDDESWRELILEEPQILGVDDFGDSAVIIRVWIKTQPMKQWDVSREFRRRFKQRLQDSKTEIPFPQRDVWLHPSGEFRVNVQNGMLRSSEDQNYESNENGHGESTNSSTKTDQQPRSIPDDESADTDSVESGDK